METADVAAMWNSPAEYNAGFVIIKPTNSSKKLYQAQAVKSLTAKSPTTDDQTALNNATEILQKPDIRLAITGLNRHRFLNGFEYFEKLKGMFPIISAKCSQKNQKSDVVVVHNNWIISKAAKIYRFREHLM